MYLTSIAPRRFLRPCGLWSTPSGGNWTGGTVGQIQADPSSGPLCGADIAPGIRRGGAGQWEKQKAELVEAIEQLEKEWKEIDGKSKQTPSHLAWDDLPEGEKFQRWLPAASNWSTPSR